MIFEQDVARGMPGNYNPGYYPVSLIQCIMNREQQSTPDIFGILSALYFGSCHHIHRAEEYVFPLKSRLALGAVALLIISFINACSSSPNASRRGIYPVDTTFSDFYREIGGEETLGPAISPSFDDAGVSYQYVLSGLMAYIPNEVPLRRFHFSPIATTEWQINGLVEPVPANPNSHYVNGHRIWEEIWSFYDQIGPDIIGLPVSGVTVNNAKQRYEQYFEGVGFYRNYTDPPGQIHLMPYGSWMCASDCQYRISDSTPPSASYSRQFSATEQLFLVTAERLGYGFTGAPLKAPRLGSDGNYEMVFENIIMYIDPTDGSRIRLRPLPAWLGIQADQPGMAVTADWLTFYQTQDELGYNVPNSFSEYLNQHGSFEYSGNPISEYRSLTDGGYSQCFTNVCLEYHPSAPQELQLRPHTLGLDYLAIGVKTSTTGTVLTEALRMNAWEDYPLISSGQIQVINIEATQKNAPMAGIEFSLVVKQPDGITKTYTLDPTGDDGTTSIELDPVNGPNGAIVQYEVCVIGAVSPQVCFSKSYTIWDQQPDQ